MSYPKEIATGDDVKRMGGGSGAGTGPGPGSGVNARRRKRRADGPPMQRASEGARLWPVSLLDRRRAAPTKSSGTFRVPHRSLTRMAAVRTTTTKRISNPKPLKFENLSRIQSYEPARIDQLGLSARQVVGLRQRQGESNRNYYITLHSISNLLFTNKLHLRL